VTERESAKADLTEVLSTDAAKRWFGGFFYACNLYGRSFNESPIVMAYKAGLQDAAKMIVDSMREIDPRLPGQCDYTYKNYWDAIRGKQEQEDDDE
jgi:hypothetical protein